MKHFQLIFPLMLTLGLALTGCHDELPDDTYPPTDESQGETRSVTSDKSPQSYKWYETSRSSDNFDTRDMGDNGTHLLWSTKDGIAFNVKIDNSGTDDYFMKHMYDGAITKYKSSDRFYIADPKGAGKPFDVKYTLVSLKEGNIYVGSRKISLEGQDHRSSCNFNMNESGPTHYRVECPEGVVFGIQKDIEDEKDDIILERVKNGQIIQNIKSDKLYIADPSGYDGRNFRITFVPVAAPATDWMKEIDGNKRLYELSIPGTHDTGTGTSGVSAGSSKCQNFKIGTQLRDGIRFLDIRIDENFQVCHGSNYTEESFTRVLEYCNDFLSSHPSETILMSIKQENLSEIPSIADDQQEEFRKEMIEYFKADSKKPISRVYRKTLIPTLNEVRGKIVMFRRFPKPNSEDWGINIWDGWPEDTRESFVNDENYFYVQDRYFNFTEGNHSTKEKIGLFEEDLKKVSGSSMKNYTFIQFGSIGAALWAVSHTPWMYAWGGPEIDPAVNPALSELLDGYLDKRTAPVRFGIIIMDFYNKHGYDDQEYLVSKIINANFAKDMFVTP